MTNPAISADGSLMLFDDGIEPVVSLNYERDGGVVTVTVARGELLACLEGDLAKLAELDDLVGSAEQLYRRTPADELRSRAHVYRLRRCALHARDIAQHTIAVLHHIRTAALLRADQLEVLAAAAAAHAVLHGDLGSNPIPEHEYASGPLHLPATLPVWHGALTCQVDVVSNLSNWLGVQAHRGQDDFAADLDRLRTWTRREPDLRAPDHLVDLPAGGASGYVVRRLPRPTMPRMADHVAAGCDYETLTAEQLTAVHMAMVAGETPLQAARSASTPQRRVSTKEVALSAQRFGIWCQQSLLSGDLHPWVAAALGAEPGQTVTWRMLQQLIRELVSDGAEQARLIPDSPATKWISSAWFDSTWGGTKTPIRVFAALYTPAVGAWYQIVRGDVHDLLGYTPMRQVHYAALLGHLAGGGTLSDYAAQQGRRYRDVLDAWDRMITHTRAVQDATTVVVDAAAALAANADLASTSRITEIVRSVKSAMEQLGLPAADSIGPAHTELLEALRTRHQAMIDHAYRSLHSRLVRLAEHLRANPFPTDPALWNREQIDTFYSRWPDLASSVVNGVSPRAMAIDTVRTEVARLVALGPNGAPRTALELLTELHHALGQALRTATMPQLPSHWGLRIGPGDPDEHVWETFVDWPDIVTVVATAKQLAADAPRAHASAPR